MIKFFKRIFGTGARAFIALVGIAGISISVANYTATQGVGTDFGSRVNGGIHYAQQLLCDMNIASVSGNCAAVAPGNTITSTMTAIAVGGQLTAISQQNGTWTVQPGNTANTTPWLVTVDNTFAPGQATMANSSPVVIASDQSAVPVSPIGLTQGNFGLVHGTTAAMVGTTSTSLVAAVTSQSLYINRVKCNNTSSTATLVQIRDGSAGTVLDTLAAGATYGGEQGTGSTPLFWTTAGNALFAQNVTTGASVICTASGYSR